MIDLMILVVVYLFLSFTSILVLAYLQTLVETQAEKIPTTEPTSSTPEAPEAMLTYSSIAIVALCIQALVSITVFTGTGYFPSTAILLAFTMLCHHAIIHRDSTFEGERFSCTPFQLKDVCNHETWVVSSIVAALISWLHC
jgi:hypothetical protein